MVKHKEQIYHDKNPTRQQGMQKFETKQFEFNGREFELIIQALKEKRQDMTNTYSEMTTDNFSAPATSEYIGQLTDLIHKLEVKA
jgi:hypothetical protein